MHYKRALIEADLVQLGLVSIARRCARADRMRARPCCCSHVGAYGLGAAVPVVLAQICTCAHNFQHQREAVLSHNCVESSSTALAS